MRPIVYAFVAAVTAWCGSTAGSAATAVPPTIIAVIGESGLNPAHEEFRLQGPPPPLPPHQVVTLPDQRGQTFDEFVRQMQAGPLGRLEPGQLYRIAGTRLLVYPPAGLPAPHDLLVDRRHGTGVVGAAVGRKQGTAADAWVVYIPTSDPSGFAWLAQQEWIDVASVSSYAVTLDSDTAGRDSLCRSVAEVRRFSEDRIFFASAGNEEHSSYVQLNAVPEMYLVGGVDANGSAVMRPGPPPSLDVQDLRFAAPFATRTFETGDRYQFQAASPDSVAAMTTFGATSGATPSTAGRAAGVVSVARTVLGDPGRRPVGLLGVAGSRTKLPTIGPLADGRFDAIDLSTVLHTLADPQLPGPGRYAVEGYGSLVDVTAAAAEPLLRGTVPLVARPQDDQEHRTSESARATLFAARGCD